MKNPFNMISTTNLWGGPLSVGRRTIVSLAFQQIDERCVDEFGVDRIETRAACLMAPDRGNGPVFGVAHLRYLVLAIFRRKVQVGLSRHDDGLRGDARKREIEVALIERIGADVAVL